MILDNFDSNKITPEILNTIIYLNGYLCDNWTVEKREKKYILKKDSIKFIINDNFNSNEIGIDIDNKTKFIYYFLYKSLINKWNIKKRKNNYVFLKKHQRKNVYFTDDYITTFMKEQIN